MEDLEVVATDEIIKQGLKQHNLALSKLAINTMVLKGMITNGKQIIVGKNNVTKFWVASIEDLEKEHKNCSKAMSYVYNNLKSSK